MQQQRARGRNKQKAEVDVEEGGRGAAAGAGLAAAACSCSVGKDNAAGFRFHIFAGGLSHDDVRTPATVDERARALPFCNTLEIGHMSIFGGVGLRVAIRTCLELIFGSLLLHTRFRKKSIQSLARSGLGPYYI